MAQATVLVVHGEPLTRASVSECLQRDGHRVLEAASAAAALRQLSEGVDLVLVDHRLRDGSAVALRRRSMEVDADVQLVMPTAPEQVKTLPRGKPPAARTTNRDEISVAVERALDMRRIRRELRQCRAEAAKTCTLHSIVGNSPAMTALRHLVARIATTAPSSPVLLAGESGTGKDLVAKVIHYSSERAARPFIKVTCSTSEDRLPERGVLESADGGTVLLDDISAMAPTNQARLLQLLDERPFRRDGDTGETAVDVRVIAASSRDLDQEVVRGRFRADLYDRLSVLPIGLPALRNHPEDIPLLVEYLIDTFNAELGKSILGATTSAYLVLQRYHWPGNIRELRNVVERAMLLAEGPRLEERDFAVLEGGNPREKAIELPASGIDLEQLEKDLVTQALRRCGGNQTRAAALLGLNRDQIRYRIEKFNLTAAG